MHNLAVAVYIYRYTLEIVATAVFGRIQPFDIHAVATGGIGRHLIPFGGLRTLLVVHHHIVDAQAVCAACLVAESHTHFLTRIVAQADLFGVDLRIILITVVDGRFPQCSREIGDFRTTLRDEHFQRLGVLDILGAILEFNSD